MGSDLNELIKLLKVLNKAQGPVALESLERELKIPSEFILNLINESLRINCPIKKSHKGYYLENKLDLLDENYIFTHTQGKGRVNVLEVTDSTNTNFLNHLKSSVSGDALLAEIQTQGRGRQGNVWHTTLGEDLMLSMIFFLEDHDNHLGLSLVAGVAVIKALQALKLKEVQLKWPNDLFYKGAKLGGILVETKRGILDSGTMAVVIGIGLNVHGSGQERSAFLKRKVACIDDFAKAKISRNDLVIKIINELKLSLKLYVDLGLSPFLENFSQFDFLYGKKISVKVGEKNVEGEALGVDENGCLKLKVGNALQFIASGYNLRLH